MNFSVLSLFEGCYHNGTVINGTGEKIVFITILNHLYKINATSVSFCSFKETDCTIRRIPVVRPDEYSLNPGWRNGIIFLVVESEKCKTRFKFICIYLMSNSDGPACGHLYRKFKTTIEYENTFFLYIVLLQDFK